MAVKRREAWAVWCVVWGFEQHEFSIISMPHGRRKALAMMALGAAACHLDTALAHLLHDHDDRDSAEKVGRVGLA